MAVLFFFVAIMAVRGYALPIATTAFVLYGPILLVWEKWIQHRRRDEPLF